MSLKEDAIEAILNAQNSAWNTLPKLVHRAALPPIAPKTTPSMLVKGEGLSLKYCLVKYLTSIQKVPKKILSR